MRTRTSAFTLIELLVVVSIIGLLIATLLPALAKAKQSSIQLQCGTNVRAIAFAYSNYAGDNRDWLPRNNFDWGSDSRTNWEGVNIDCLVVSVRNILTNQYGLVQKMWDCPNARAIDPNTRTGWSGTSSMSWSAPYSYGTIQWIDTGYALWAGRTQGYRALSSAAGNGITPDESPSKASQRLMYKNGNTPLPWLNDAQIYRPATQNWSFFADSNDAQIMHWRSGINAANPDGSVIFKKWPGSIVTDIYADSNMLKYTLDFSVPGVAWKYAY